MTPTVTKAGGTVHVECPTRPQSGDTWSMTGLDTEAIGSGAITESPLLTVDAYTADDDDTDLVTVSGAGHDAVRVGQWLQGLSADGQDWRGWVAGATPGESASVLRVDGAVGAEPAEVWDSRASITIPAVTEYGTYRLDLTLSDELYSAAVECVESPLRLQLRLGDLLSAYPTMHAKRSMFSQPSQWAGIAEQARNIIDAEIRTRGDRTRLLLGDEQVRPALIEAARYVLAQNGIFVQREGDFPIEAVDMYRKRFLKACDGVFTSAAYRTEHSTTEVERVPYRTLVASR